MGRQESSAPAPLPMLMALPKGGPWPGSCFMETCSSSLRITLHSAALQKGHRGSPTDNCGRSVNTVPAVLKGSPHWAAGQAFMDPQWEKANGGRLQPHVVELLWLSRGYVSPAL